MSEKILFENMYRLTKQLKGAPRFQKKRLLKINSIGLKAVHLNAAEKAIACGLLYGDPPFIYEKAEAWVMLVN